VKPRLQPWQFVILVVLVAAAVIGYMQWRRASRLTGAAGLLQCLPQERFIHLYIDVDLLRRSGFLDLLAGSKAAEEPDYRKFITDTGFDYRQDLDAVAAAFLRDELYITVRGRFDWNRLTAYAQAQNGRCENSICSMPASQPNRFVSFYPLSSTVLALAVTPVARGVSAIVPGSWEAAPQVPPVAAWLSVPPMVFDDVSDLPSGSRSFLSPLARVLKSTFSIGPAAAGGNDFEIRLEAECASPQQATELAQRFASTTDLLRRMLEREKLSPNSADLSGVLTGGRFNPQEARMVGTWPVSRMFVESLLSGTLE
jgi:hypothetical protein